MPMDWPGIQKIPGFLYKIYLFYCLLQYIFVAINNNLNIMRILIKMASNQGAWYKGLAGNVIEAEKISSEGRAMISREEVLRLLPGPDKLEHNYFIAKEDFYPEQRIRIFDQVKGDYQEIAGLEIGGLFGVDVENRYTIVNPCKKCNTTLLPGDFMLVNEPKKAIPLHEDTTNSINVTFPIAEGLKRHDYELVIDGKVVPADCDCERCLEAEEIGNHVKDLVKKYESKGDLFGIVFYKEGDRIVTPKIKQALIDLEEACNNSYDGFMSFNTGKGMSALFDREIDFVKYLKDLPGYNPGYNQINETQGQDMDKAFKGILDIFREEIEKNAEYYQGLVKKEVNRAYNKDKADILSRYRGLWEAKKTYFKGETVSYLGTFYRLKISTIKSTHRPSDSLPNFEFWEKIEPSEIGKPYKKLMDFLFDPGHPPVMVKMSDLIEKELKGMPYFSDLLTFGWKVGTDKEKPKNPTEYVYRGGFRSNEVYLKGDVVIYNSTYYIALLPTGPNDCHPAISPTRWYKLPNQNFIPDPTKKLIVDVQSNDKSLNEYLLRRKKQLKRAIGKYTSIGRSTPEYLKFQLNEVELQISNRTT